MTTPTRRLRLVAAGFATISLVVVGCSSAASSSPAASAAVASATASATASAGGSVQPTAVPTVTATPTVTAVPSRPSPSSAACALVPQAVALPSDRFTDIKVSSGATADRLTFVFGNPSLPGPAGPPQGSLEVAPAPYTFAGSGAPIEMAGDHVLQVRFSGMSLSNDVGQETYVGPPEVKPDLPALRQAVMFDASEGIVGWYVGYDGPGCVTLVRTTNDLTLTIDHQ